MTPPSVEFLVKGNRVLVSQMDFDRVSKYSWLTTASGDYIGRWFWGPKRWVALARFIDETPEDSELDHINRNPFDNRRENLRRCTRKQNSYNRGPHTGKYKGVSFDGRQKQWRASITKDGKFKHLGYFDCKKQAATVYNKKAKELFGDFAFLNEI